MFSKLHTFWLIFQLSHSALWETSHQRRHLWKVTFLWQKWLQCWNWRKETWVIENQRLNFPKSPGPLVDILTNKCKTKQFVSKIISFSGVCGGQAMGVGNFPAWDMFEVGRLPQVELTCCTINNVLWWLVSASRFFESGTLTFKFKREKSAACLNWSIKL